MSRCKIEIISLPHHTKKITPIISIVHYPPAYDKFGIKIFNRDVRVILFGKTYHIIFTDKKEEEE